MPTEAEHVRLSLHNMEVAAHLLPNPGFCDWTCTIVFYSALHIIEAVLSSKKNTFTPVKHGHDHHGREEILKYTNNFSALWKHYRPLQSISQVARYLEDSGKTTPLFEDYLPAAQVPDVVIKMHFGGLIRAASRFLGKTESKSITDGFKAYFRSILCA